MRWLPVQQAAGTKLAHFFRTLSLISIPGKQEAPQGGRSS